MSALDLEIRQVLLTGVTGSYISFTEPFIKFPYITVVLSGTVVGVNSGSNLNSSIRNVSVTGFDLEFSEVFTGYVHYKAARSE
jgi:hypothetical protein